MQKLFFTIFGAVLLCIVLLVSATYTAISEINKSRYQQYLKHTSALTKELIKRGVNRQAAENTDTWINLVANLAGITLDKMPSHTTRKRLTNNQLIATDNRNAAQLHFAVDQISEQLVSSTAFLTLNELGQLAVEQRHAALAELSHIAHYPIERIAKHQVSLTEKQRLRLNRGETVVVRHIALGGLDSISAYAPWGTTEDLLVLGPIPYFDKYPWQMIAFVSGLLVAAIALVLWFFLTALRNRIVQMQQQVDALGWSDVQHVSNDKNRSGKKDSIESLKLKIDSMAKRINHLLDEKTHMIRAISHDLRTPITKVHFRLERLAKLSPKNAYLVLSCKQDLSKLDTLIDELLSIEQLEQDASEQLSELDLAHIIGQELHDIGQLYPKLDLRFVFDHNGLNRMIGYQSQIERLLTNLLTNAAKYTRHSITVTLQRDLDNMHIQVKDDGLGVADEQLNKIFLPFFKADTSRGEVMESYGLGLAICQQITANHRGSICAANLTSGGLSVDLTLPINGFMQQAC